MRSFVPRCALYVSVLGGVFTGGCAPATARHDPASTTITAEELARYPGEPIENILERKVPGIVVTRTADGGIALRIRGVSSFDGSDTSPLYILNDLPIEAGRDGALPSLNPYDIESIRVLKGAEAALHGIRGANGVIIITTKKTATKREPLGR
jgi:TonB-dependent SusC/RagA subfamily outer membrane receptor